jgi:hypothetical protein
MSPTTRRTYGLLLGAAPGLDEELASEIALLQALDTVDEIHVWVSRQAVAAVRSLVSTNAWQKVAAVKSVQATRDATIFGTLTMIRPTVRDEDLVLIADVERRSLNELTVSSCLSVAAEQGAAILASEVVGDVIHASASGRLAGLPREGGTFVAAGLLVTEFRRVFDLYNWASTVAKGSIDSAYRWSLSQIQPVVVVLNDRGREDSAAEVTSESAKER